jgi:hypothetical protein
MNQGEIVRMVTAVLQETQTLSGRVWQSVDLNTRPIGQLEGFDSLCGLEATLMLEAKLGCSFEESVFVSADGTRALALREIAAAIATHVGEK